MHRSCTCLLFVKTTMHFKIKTLAKSIWRFLADDCSVNIPTDLIPIIVYPSRTAFLTLWMHFASCLGNVNDRCFGKCQWESNGMEHCAWSMMYEERSRKIGRIVALMLAPACCLLDCRLHAADLVRRRSISSFVFGKQVVSCCEMWNIW